VATLTPKQAKLFQDANFGALATIREDGAPNVTPVWVDWDGTSILVNTSYGRAKDVQLRRDPRCTILVVNAGNPYDWVSVTGRAVLAEEGAEAHIDKLAMKYEGAAKYPYMEPGERRVKIAITPERVITHQPGDVLIAKARARLRRRGVAY
jgi:PPOX class probable F420-dependent enzyme